MQQLVNDIFNLAEYWLNYLGDITGLGYQMINYILFIGLQPGLIIIFFILWRLEIKKNKLRNNK